MNPERLFGIAVRTARQTREWSQEALAANLAEAGISVGGQSGVARIERGERPTRLNEAIGIASFLGIDLAIFGQRPPLSDGERLGVHLAQVQRHLRELEAEIQTITGELHRARKLVHDLERRLADCEVECDAVMTQRAKIIDGLRKAGDSHVQRELDMLEASDRWRVKGKRYGKH